MPFSRLAGRDLTGMLFIEFGLVAVAVFALGAMIRLPEMRSMIAVSV